MSRHTPGPWRVWMKPAGRGTVPFVQAEGDSEAIAQVFGGERSSEAREANANLIAAAPELLEALKNIENDDGHVPAPIWDLVCIAIAKAEGAK